MQSLPALTAALLLGLSTTATATLAPESTAPDSFQQLSTQLMAIDDAVEATRDDPKALCFVVVLPEFYDDARDIRDQWTSAKKRFNNSKHHGQQVFFVRGQDAQFVLEASYINQAPAAIAYRNGRPHHSRTGTMTEKNIQAFLAISFDNHAPTTSAPDQTAFLFSSMNELAFAGQQTPAAKGACQIMLNLHALINGPYASTYSASDLAEMTALYNQTQITLSSFDTTNQSVLDEINATRAIAIRTWNKRTKSTFGFGIWSDLAMITGDTNEVLTWIDQGLDSPSNHKRVAQSLADYGQPLAQLLIDSHRYQALAMTITSPNQIQSQLAAAALLADEIAQIDPDSSDSYNTLVDSATNKAAASHAALLFAGRDSEAWQIAQFTQDFAGLQLASAALCSAAINAAVLTDQHATLAHNLDPSTHASLINAMNTTFAVVPTDD